MTRHRFDPGWLDRLLDNLDQRLTGDPWWIRKYGDRATGAERPDRASERGTAETPTNEP